MLLFNVLGFLQVGLELFQDALAGFLALVAHLLEFVDFGLGNFVRNFCGNFCSDFGLDVCRFGGIALGGCGGEKGESRECENGDVF